MGTQSMAESIAEKFSLTLGDVQNVIRNSMSTADASAE